MFEALLELACPIQPGLLHFRESRGGGHESKDLFQRAANYEGVCIATPANAAVLLAE